MRPTIPLAEWRIATDLEATRALQTLAGQPASDCACAWCRNWSLIHRKVLPATLSSQLHRLTIQTGRPSDLYAFSESTGRIDYRVTYYCAGVILEGPQLWTEDPRLGRMRNYRELRKAPEWLSLSLAPNAEVDQVPSWCEVASAKTLIQIDFRLQVPWALPEPHPPITVPHLSQG